MLIKPAALAVISLFAAPLALAADAPTAPEAKLAVPQSIQAEYDQLLTHLSHAIEQHGNAAHLAQAAQKARDIIRAHYDKDAQFVFPPLGLLPTLADGRVTPAMAPAVRMGERVRAEHEQLLEENVRITNALNELIAAAKDQNDQELVAFGTHAALRSLHEIEVLQPTTVLVGEYISMKLSGTPSQK